MLLNAPIQLIKNINIILESCKFHKNLVYLHHIVHTNSLSYAAMLAIKHV